MTSCGCSVFRSVAGSLLVIAGCGDMESAAMSGDTALLVIRTIDSMNKALISDSVDRVTVIKDNRYIIDRFA
jgi:hypothetical protein